MQTVTSSVRELNRLPLAAFKPLFSSLSAAPLAAISGVHRGEIVGPGWVRTIGGFGLIVGGLGGWWGKQLGANGQGTNLVERAGVVRDTIPMQLEQRASQIDGRPVTALIYPPGSRFPWGFFIDELRPLDGQTYLGLSYVKWPGLRNIALPFRLERAG